MTSFRNKLILGTAQFGLHYGINNSTGKITGSEAAAILQLCTQNQISFLDTSNAYGNAHDVLGNIIQRNQLAFEIISKLNISTNNNIRQEIEHTFLDLQVERLYGYLCHNFNYFQRNSYIWKYFTDLKAAGKTKKIGFSLYHPHEFDWLMQSKIPFDIIQVPYNIFDQRFSRIFDRCADAGIEVHVRSLFLQGLFFKSAADLPLKFSAVAPKIEALHQYSTIRQIPLEHILLCYGLSRKNIDKVVIGVDSLSNLESNLRVEHYSDADIDLEYLDSFSETDESVIIPANW